MYIHCFFLTLIIFSMGLLISLSQRKLDLTICSFPAIYMFSASLKKHFVIACQCHFNLLSVGTLLNMLTLHSMWRCPFNYICHGVIICVIGVTSMRFDCQVSSSLAIDTHLHVHLQRSTVNHASMKMHMY